MPQSAPRPKVGLSRRIAWIFVGPTGLRLGWSVLLFLLMAGVVQIGLAIGLSAAGVSSAVMGRDPDSALGTIRVVSLMLVSVVVATVGMALIERRGPAQYGLAPRPLLPRLAQGAAIGLAMMAALAGILVVLGALRLDPPALDGAQALRQGLLWMVACLMIGLYEELVLRGYLLARLARSLGYRWAIILTSLLFAAGHLSNAGEGWIGLVSVVLIGLVFGYSVWKTGSLWWAIGYHAAWNWAQSFLFGVGNSGHDSTGSLMSGHPLGAAWLSGGPTGPEGSLLNLVVIAATAALLRWGVRGAPVERA